MKKIAIKLKPAAERMVKKGHPWVFEDSIVKKSLEPSTGDLCIIFDSAKNRFLALGLYDEDSPIKIKLLHFHKNVNFNDELILNNIDKSYEKRKTHFNDSFNAYRLIYGESDNFPSIIIDIYNRTAVVKIYSLIWAEYLDLISDYIYSKLNLDCVLLRLSRNIEKKAINKELFNGKILKGELKNKIIKFKENSFNFTADVVDGHKTGYFLDQRKNREKVGLLSNNKIVLDVFAYNGGFTVNALCNGAKSATSVDISEHALKSISDNLNLNKFKGEYNTILGDAFKVLEDLIKKKMKYDIVVIDPPAFAKSEREIETAKKQYERLAKLGSQLVNKNGYLILASCSSRINSDDFFEINKLALKNTNFKLIEQTFHDFDHPAEIQEMKYLKCAYYKLN